MTLVFWSNWDPILCHNIISLTPLFLWKSVLSLSQLVPGIIGPKLRWSILNIKVFYLIFNNFLILSSSHFQLPDIYIIVCTNDELNHSLPIHDNYSTSSSCEWVMCQRARITSFLHCVIYETLLLRPTLQYSHLKLNAKICRDMYGHVVWFVNFFPYPADANSLC